MHMNYKIKQKHKKNIFKDLFEWVLTIVIAVVVSLFIVSNIASVTTIKEQSMEPTLQENNRVIVYNWAINLVNQIEEILS